MHESVQVLVLMEFRGECCVHVCVVCVSVYVCVHVCVWYVVYAGTACMRVCSYLYFWISYVYVVCVCVCVCVVVVACVGTG